MTDNAHFPQTAYAAPAPRGRAASFWIAWILFAVLCLSMLFNLVLLIGVAVAGAAAGAGADAAGKQYSETAVEGSGNDKVVVIDVHGAISDNRGQSFFGESSSPLERIVSQLKQAREDAEVRAVILDINSPGGEVTASDVIYHEVMRTRDAGKKVVVHMGSTCASGGYYISAPADTIIASPTTITGSIGVIFQVPNFKGAMNLFGIGLNTIKSGPYKDIGNPARDMKPDERELLQKMVDSMYDRFITVVADGRKGHGKLPAEAELAKQAIRIIADGRIYTGQEAVDNGLADKLGYLSDAFDEAKKLAGISQARIVRYRKEQGLFGMLAASADKPANVNTGVQIDAASLGDAMMPRLEYRWIPSAP